MVISRRVIHERRRVELVQHEPEGAVVPLAEDLEAVADQERGADSLSSLVRASGAGAEVDDLGAARRGRCR